MFRLISHIQGIKSLKLVERFFTVLFLTVFLCSIEAQACVNSTVRDGAFLIPRDVHRLAVMAKTGDAVGEETFQTLQTWFNTSGLDLNVDLFRVAAEDPNVRWNEYGIPSAPPSLPVTVLAGYYPLERRTFYIDHWEPGPGTEDLEMLKDSPVRQAIRQEVGQRIAVLLFAPGPDSEAGTAENVLDAVVEFWSDKEPLGVSVVRLDRSDDREQMLLSFAGIEKSGPDWVGVVFGRGKLVPPLVGDGITEAGLNETIQWLIEPCTCLRPPSTFGVDIPMIWNDALDAAVVPLRDREDPLEAVWAAPFGPETGDSPLGSRRIVTAMLGTVSFLVLVVGIATVLVLRRRNRRDAASVVN